MLAYPLNIARTECATAQMHNSKLTTEHRTRGVHGAGLGPKLGKNIYREFYLYDQALEREHQLLLGLGSKCTQYPVAICQLITNTWPGAGAGLSAAIGLRRGQRGRRGGVPGGRGPDARRAGARAAGLAQSAAHGVRS